MKNSPINRFEQFNDGSVVVRDQSAGVWVYVIVSDRDIISVTKTHVLFHIYEHWAELELSWTDLNGANNERIAIVLLILLFCFLLLFSSTHFHPFEIVDDVRIGIELMPSLIVNEKNELYQSFARAR